MRIMSNTLAKKNFLTRSLSLKHTHRHTCFSIKCYSMRKMYKKLVTVNSATIYMYLPLSCKEKGRFTCKGKGEQIEYNTPV